MRSGFVSIIGRPNVGKSTLLNTLINEKIAITSNKPGTTRNIIQGIYNNEDYQIIFVDTPGIHRPINKLGKVLNKQAYSHIRDVDLVLFIADASEKFGKVDKMIMQNLESSDSPVILVLNKIDLINQEDIIKKIEEYKDLFPFAEIVPISAAKNNNVNRLLDVIKVYMSDDVRYFETDTITSNSTKFMVSEFVREKLLNETEKEVPHRITCVTSSYEEKANIVNIVVDIIVDRDSLKKIVIGKKGERLKLVGSEARKDIENMLGKKVYLELFVKTVKDWRNKDRNLTELGFIDN